MPAPIRRVDELGFPIPPKFEDFQTGESEPRRPRRPFLKLLGRWRWLILLLVPAILFGPQAVDFVRGIVANIQLERAEQDVRQHNLPRAVYHASRAIAWEPDPQRRAQAIALRAYLHEKLKHLDESLKDYDEALRAVGDHNTAMLDTRACLEYRQGKFDAALGDMDMAIKGAEAERHGRQLGWEAGPVFVAPDEYELDDASFAVMLFHRGEIHRKLAEGTKDAGEAESHRKEADADIGRAKELGFESKQDEALERAPRG
jgi:tetratricopeptide (TPR) repeat protein